MTRPEAQSTGPGTDRPMPQTRSCAVPVFSSRSANHCASRSSTRSGPSAITNSAECSASTVPGEVEKGGAACRVPRSAARTTACSASNSSRVEGRPPVEPSTGAASPSRSQPAAKSWSSRCPTVDRDSPVARCSSPRVVARPSRMSRSRWPALAWFPVICSSALVRTAGQALGQQPFSGEEEDDHRNGQHHRSCHQYGLGHLDAVGELLEAERDGPVLRGRRRGRAERTGTRSRRS